MRVPVYARHVVARSIRNARQGNIGILFAFFACLVILVRALSGAGYDEELAARSAAELAASQEASLLRRWQARGQARLQDGWSRLSRPGRGLWEGVVKKERQWHEAYIVPAVDAWKQKTSPVTGSDRGNIAGRNRLLKKKGGDGDAVEGDQVDGEEVAVDDTDVEEEQIEPPSDEDEDLFAPEHEYMTVDEPVQKAMDAPSTSSENPEPSQVKREETFSTEPVPIRRRARREIPEGLFTSGAA